MTISKDMIQSLMLRQCKGRYDPKDLEGVLPVLYRRLYDGGDGGVVLCAGLGPEASADLEFGLGRPECLLAVVVRGWDERVGEERKDVVPVLPDTILELVKLGLLSVVIRIYRRTGEQFVQPFFHIPAYFRPYVPLMSLMDGVPQEVQHVHAPGVFLEGLGRIGEVPQQVGDADLVIFHSYISHEVGGPAVCHPDYPSQLLWSESLVHGIVAPALVEGQICGNITLEGPQPVVLSGHVDSGLVRPGDLACGHSLTDHLIGSLGELPHSVQHVGHGPLADMQTEDGLVQVREPSERDVLVGAEVRGQGHVVRTVGHRSVYIFQGIAPCSSGHKCI